MKKFYISAIIALAMVASATSCGNREARHDSETTENEVETKGYKDMPIADEDEDDAEDPQNPEKLIVGEFGRKLALSTGNPDITANEERVYVFKDNGDFTYTVTTESSNGFLQETTITGRYKVRKNKLRIKYNKEDVKFNLIKDPCPTEEQRQKYIDDNIVKITPNEALTIKEYELFLNNDDIALYEKDGDFYLVRMTQERETEEPTPAEASAE